MNGIRQKMLIAASAALLAMMSIAVASAQAKSNKEAMKDGSHWIAKATKKSLREFPGNGFIADAVSALAAARKSGDGLKSSADDALVKIVSQEAVDYATSAGATGKVILAAVAAGNNPQCFGDDPPGKIDLYALLQTFYDNSGSNAGQFGSTAFDQALAMLATKAAHHKVPSAAVKFARDHRGGNGWNFALSTSAGDDVESTAIMIQAMRAAGVSKSDKSLKTAFKWIKNQRNTDGGYNPTDPGGLTQANTTAYAIAAGDAMGDGMSKAKTALRALQKPNGWFRDSSGADGKDVGIATSDAVIALSGRHFPVASRSKVGASCG